MTEASGRTPIEPEIRAEELPDDAVVIIQAGPMTVEKLLAHARREAARYSYRDTPLAAVSVDATVAGYTVEAILRDRLWSRSTFATTSVGTLREGGFRLLPTFEAPHYDLVLPAATPEAASTLLSLFGPAERNPYRRRR